MSIITHPALMNQGVRREQVTVEDWSHQIDWLTARIQSERSPSQRRLLVRMRMQALAFRDAAWLARENGITELLGAK